MTDIQYVHVDTDVTCLLTADGRFVGAVKCSQYPDQPWAYGVDRDGLILVNVEASEEAGELLNDIYRKCERVLLETFTTRTKGTEPLSDVSSPSAEPGDRPATQELS
jgi:hypothetical protein